MGVSGCGKSTIGKLLATNLDIPFLEGDAFHPQANVDKMRSGIPLTNDDREGWIGQLAIAANQVDGPCVISCSALNQTVRSWIEAQFSGVCQYILLEGSREELLARLNGREGHFFPAHLLDTQLQALEVPVSAMRLNIRMTPKNITQQIMYKIAPQRG